MSNLLKNKLFILGDSFAKWPEPKGKHWSELMQEHFDVRNFGYPGASFTDTALQTTYIKDFEEGDRIVIVLTELTRTYKVLRKDLEKLELKEEADLIKRLMLVRQKAADNVLSDSGKMYQLKNNGQSNLYQNPLLDFYFLLNLRKRYSQYRPVYVTWNEQTNKFVKEFIKDLIYIPLSKTPSLNQEGIVTDNIDYHPGIEGNKLWFDRILSKLVGDPKNSSYI